MPYFITFSHKIEYLFKCKKADKNRLNSKNKQINIKCGSHKDCRNKVYMIRYKGLC